MRHFWKKQLPAFLLALVLIVGLVPAASAAGAAIVKEVEEGESLTFQVRDFDKLLKGKDNLDCIQLIDENGVFDNGRMRTDLKNGDTGVRIDERNYMENYLDADGKGMGPKDGYLKDTAYTPEKGTAGKTVTLTFVAIPIDREKDPKPVTGTMEIRIVARGSGSTASDADILFSVDAGDSVMLSRSEFSSYYDKFEKDNLESMVFTNYSKLDDCGNLLAIDADGKNAILTEKKLDNAEFYYSASQVKRADEYAMSGLTFEADKGAKGIVTLDFILYGDNGGRQKGVLEINVGKADASGKADLTLSVKPGKYESVSRTELRSFFRDAKTTTGELDYLVFTDVKGLDDFGVFTADDAHDKETILTEKNLKGAKFYYSSSDVTDKGEYSLSGLTFEADRHAEGDLYLDFTMYGTDRDSLKGVLKITTGSSAKTLTYKLNPGEKLLLNKRDFSDLYEEEYKYLSFMEFTSFQNLDQCGTIHAEDYFGFDNKFEAMSLPSTYFFYDEEDMGKNDYSMRGMYFASKPESAGQVVNLGFTMYGEKGNDPVDGLLKIEISGQPVVPGNPSAGFSSTADICYFTTTGTAVSIKPEDVARFYAEKVPGGQLQYVTLGGVPTSGQLFYNFSGKSPYGAKQMPLTSANYRSQAFAYRPASTAEFALSELAYVPFGANFCTAIPFTAYGTDGRAASGIIFIGVTSKKVSEVYGTILKNTSASFPAIPVYTAMKNATGVAMGGIQLLRLPKPSEGMIVVNNNGVNTPANTSTRYSYGYTMNLLRFIPASGYTGSVEIPYAAYNAQGNLIGAGSVDLGVLKAQPKQFKDMNNGTWCYKYVIELADQGIIGGYSDGTFKEKNALTWRAAIKLICLANNVGKSADSLDTFMKLARDKGWVVGNVNPASPITRQQFCQVAARAMGLDTSVQRTSPFSDTKDPAVLALNAAGIIGGYADGTFLPNKTLTRGHISAIIWRMNQAR